MTLARWNGGYGYTVIVNVGNDVELVYGHASKLLVQEGQKVKAGDLLALTGNTGYSFEPCVHFEVRINGATTNPITVPLRPRRQPHEEDRLAELACSLPTSM